MCIVEAENVSKSYGKMTALNEITFKVEKGELFGLIGPDGAGKTTLFRILATLLTPDSGRVSVLGLDAVAGYRKIRSQVGYMPGRFALYRDLTVRENIDFFASVFGATLEENYDLVAPIYSQLERFEERLAGALSGGMKQKLALSCALIHKPGLLVLDEPTTGVDAVSRKEFWQILHQLKAKGMTILASTPYMDEAEQCDRVALMQGGRILSIDTPAAITSEFEKKIWSIVAPNKYRLIQVLRDYRYADSVQPFGETVHYTDQRENPDMGELRDMLREHGISEPGIEQVQPDIEDLFIRLMEQEESDD